MSYKNHVVAVPTWQTCELWHRNEICVTQVSCLEVLCRNKVQKICSSRWGFLSSLLSILQEGKQDHELINLSVCPCVPHTHIPLKLCDSHSNLSNHMTTCRDIMYGRYSARTLISLARRWEKTDARTSKMAAMLTTQYWVQKWGMLTDLQNTGRFIMFSVITNIYNEKTKGPTLMELFTDIGKPEKLLSLSFFFFSFIYIYIYI